MQSWALQAAWKSRSKQMKMKTVFYSSCKNYFCEQNIKKKNLLPRRDILGFILLLDAY